MASLRVWGRSAIATRVCTSNNTLCQSAIVSRQTGVALLARRHYAEQPESKGKGSDKSSEQKARPKILEHGPPAELSEDAKKHNEEFERRADRASNSINDDGSATVGEKFWKESNSRKS